MRRKVSSYSLLFALLILSVAAAGGDMSSLEAEAFDRIYSMPDSLRWFALVVTQLGNVWVVIGLVGLLFVVKWNPKPSLLVLRNGVLTYIAVEVMKLLINRPRPAILLSEITAREIAVFGNGFPSGHAALATAVSLTLLPYLPKHLRWLPVAWIGLVAWSRIYLGVHAPLDVLGGFAIGALVVLLADVIPWPQHKKR
jgi:membrane-associated phospholipid phosphatase